MYRNPFKTYTIFPPKNVANGYLSFSITQKAYFLHKLCSISNKDQQFYKLMIDILFLKDFFLNIIFTFFVSFFVANLWFYMGQFFVIIILYFCGIIRLFRRIKWGNDSKEYFLWKDFFFADGMKEGFTRFVDFAFFSFFFVSIPN